MGTVSALVRGSPDDAEDAIKAQAIAAKADYYVIIMVDETIITGQWYSQEPQPIQRDPSTLG